MADKVRRSHNQKWRGIYGRDRAYTARIDRAAARAGYDPFAASQQSAHDWMMKEENERNALGARLNQAAVDRKRPRKDVNPS